MRSRRVLEKKKPIHVVTQAFISFAVLVLLASGSFAAAGEIAEVTVATSGIYFRPLVESDGWLLSVSGPDDYGFEMEFLDGESPYLSLFDEGGAPLPDGAYTYELSLVFENSTSGGNPGAESGPDGRSAQAQPPLPPSGPTAQTGYFTVTNGGIVTPDGIGEYSSAGVSVPAADEPVPPADHLIYDDLIVTGSTCIGFDCANGESFGYDTLKLKENNLRFKFEDTSIGSFPSNDWQLTANDTVSGGANKFSIDDVTGGRTPFTIEAGAPSHSLYVDDGGKLGLGTSTPVVEAHVKDGDTPTLRLEQDGSSGFAPQTWDVAGNETNFFIRDVTNGSQLPFKILPGADSDSLVISSNNYIGVGTRSPSNNLHIKDGSSTAARRELFRLENKGGVQFVLEDTDAGDEWKLSVNNGFRVNDTGISGGSEFQITTDGTVIMGPGGAANFTLDASGNLHILGNLSAGGTKNFVTTDPGDPGTTIHYAALEGPEAGTYCRGTARTVQGEAAIELPDHFAKVTEVKGLTVQITPRGGWYHLYTVEISPERLVVRAADGKDSIEFDYLVQGIRKGYLDYRVVRPAAPSVQN